MNCEPGRLIYIPCLHESETYDMWENARRFRCLQCKDLKRFTIVKTVIYEVEGIGGFIWRKEFKLKSSPADKKRLRWFKAMLR